MVIFEGCFLVILLIFLINKYLNDPKYYNPDDFYLKKDKNGKIVLGYKKFIFDMSDESLIRNSQTMSADYQNFYLKDLNGKKVRKVTAKRVQNYLNYYKHRIINNLREIEYKEKAYTNEQVTKNVDHGIDKKFNRKYLLRITLAIFILVFVLGSYFIYDILPDNRKIVSSVFIIGLGIIELILWAVIVTNPYFQNSKDFEIHEMQNGNRKIINIRYKNYEFELLDRFNINHLKNAERNDKHVSIINRYRIKRYYKYALLNILNKPMDLKNIEKYKSARRATDYEISEYIKILEKTRKGNIWNNMPVFLQGLIISLIFSFVVIIIGLMLKDNVLSIGFGIFVFYLCFGDYNSIDFYKSKKRKKVKKILKLLEIGQIYIVEAKVLLHKFRQTGSTKRFSSCQKAIKLTIFVDEEGNYIDEWFYDGVEYDSSGFGFQEFPDYTTATEKFFVIKYNGEIIVDKEIGL